MKSRITKGDIGNRSEGLGNLPASEVRERAIELAVADGRPEDELRQEDLDRAERELRAEREERERVGEEEIRPSVNLSPDASAGSPGQVATNPYSGDDNQIQDLVEEGVEEAVHDEMVESGKETLEEGEEENRQGG